VINTIIAESLDYVADKIRSAKGSDFGAKVLGVVAQIFKETRAIRFEGNNYAEEWVKEAKKRGLPNVAATYKALEAWVEPKAVALFEKYKVLTKEELVARQHIFLHTYNLTLEMEASTLYELVNASVVPSGCEYEQMLAEILTKLSVLKKTAQLKIDAAVLDDQKAHLADIAAKIYYVRRNTQEMKELLKKAQSLSNEKKAELYYLKLKPLMDHVRRHVDDLEQVVSDEHWDLPKYREMLFVK
jgi:glutamine synthetase